MNALMIDLETLDTRPRAVVLQLGWAVFDPAAEAEGVTARGCWHLSPEPQFARGHQWSWETFLWWLAQGEDARALLQRADRTLPSDALAGLDAVWREHRCQQVWSHGSTFDIVIVEALMATAGVRPPWTYREARDTRTLFWLAGDRLVWPDNPVKHSAEHDAVAQAVAVQRAVRLVQRRETCTS